MEKKTHLKDISADITREILNMYSLSGVFVSSMAIWVSEYELLMPIYLRVYETPWTRK
jgi:hypothetical protein